MKQPDDELERRLADWLEAEAEQMPAELRATVQEVPGRHTQLGTQRRLAGPCIRLFAAAAATAALVVAVVVGASFLRDLRQAIGGPSPETSGPVSPPTGYEWDVMLNFVDRNPANDGYGHTAVWTYLSGPVGSRDPSEYQPLPTVDRGELPRWYDPAIAGLEMSLQPGDDRVQIRPASGGPDGTAAIIAWRNPIDSLPMRVIGSVEVDGSCGDGISLAITWQGRTEHGEIQTIRLPRGRESFDVFLDGFDPGGLLYFIVEPGSDSRCDTTWLSVTIHAPATRDEPPPADE